DRALDRVANFARALLISRDSHCVLNRASFGHLAMHGVCPRPLFWSIFDHRDSSCFVRCLGYHDRPLTRLARCFTWGSAATVAAAATPKSIGRLDGGDKH